MKITTVHYSALVNTGNYENEKIGLDAQLEEGETVAQVVEALKEQCFSLVDKRDLLETRRRLHWDVRELEEKLAEAKEQWNRTAEFLRAQGIRPDAPDLPIPGVKLLAVSERVHAEVIDDGSPEDGK